MRLYKKKLNLRKIYAYIALSTSVGTYVKPRNKTEFEVFKSNFEKIGVLNEKGVKVSLDKGVVGKDNEGIEYVLDYNCALEINNANVTAENIAAFEAFEGKECFFLLEYDDGDVKVIKNVIPYVKEEDISGDVGSMLITASKNCKKKQKFRDFFNAEFKISWGLPHIQTVDLLDSDSDAEVGQYAYVVSTASYHVKNATGWINTFMSNLTKPEGMKAEFMYFTENTTLTKNENWVSADVEVQAAGGGGAGGSYTWTWKSSGFSGANGGNSQFDNIVATGGAGAPRHDYNATGIYCIDGANGSDGAVKKAYIDSLSSLIPVIVGTGGIGGNSGQQNSTDTGFIAYGGIGGEGGQAGSNGNVAGHWINSFTQFFNPESDRTSGYGGAVGKGGIGGAKSSYCEQDGLNQTTLNWTCVGWGGGGGGGGYIRAVIWVTPSE